MKTLILSALAVILLAACQPSGRGTAANETLTQLRQDRDRGKVSMDVKNEQEVAAAAQQERFVPKSKAFATFLKGFPEASLPLALNSRTSKSINNEAYINSSYVRFIPEIAEESFSREVGKEYYYLARVGESKHYVSVVYAVKNVMMGDNAPYGYVLASYNQKGKRVDKVIAGGQIELDEALRVGRIDANRAVEIKEFNQQWEKNPKKEGYYDNKVVGTSLKQTKYYRLMENGTIQRMDASAVAMR